MYEEQVASAVQRKSMESTRPDIEPESVRL